MEINETLRELILGILIFGFLFWILPIWFVEEKGSYTLGLLIGVAGAVFQALHMNYSIGRSLELLEKDATGYMQKMAAIRMGATVLLFGLVCLLGLGYPLATFAGLFSLKLGAYFQPILHRLMEKKERKGG
jgi:hypothetical protein